MKLGESEQSHALIKQDQVILFNIKININSDSIIATWRLIR